MGLKGIATNMDEINGGSEINEVGQLCQQLNFAETLPFVQPLPYYRYVMQNSIERCWNADAACLACAKLMHRDMTIHDAVPQ